MGKKKAKRKKRLRNERLADAQIWVHDFENADDLPQEYENRYGVAKSRAIKELEMIGFEFSKKFKGKVKKQQHKQAIENRKRNIYQKLKHETELLSEWDLNFGQIKGTTSGGLPFVITYEEQDDFDGEIDFYYDDFEPDTYCPLNSYYQSFEESYVSESHLNYLELADYEKDYDDICEASDHYYFSTSRRYFHHNPLDD